MESRQSRMDKYFELEDANKNATVESDTPVKSSRLQKNQELYKQVSSLDIEGFDMNSNSKVLDSNVSDIDLDDVKERLEEQYHENPRNKVLGDTDEINLPKINLDETREYDINAILEKAKAEKEINYEEDRHRKVNDVLKDIEEYTKRAKKSPEEDASMAGVSSEEELQTLIDTINAKELIDEEENLEVTGDMDPLDLLSDLKGDDDNTKVLGQLTEDLALAEELGLTEEVTEELSPEDLEALSELGDEDTEEIIIEEVEEETEEQPIVEETTEDQPVVEESTEEIPEVTEEQPIIEEKSKKKEKKEKKKKKKDLDLTNSFIGKTTQFSQEDFDDFDDLKEDMKVTKVIIKILVIIIVLVFIAGLIVLANSKFNWGLF